jgi:hypothetical protein
VTVFRFVLSSALRGTRRVERRGNLVVRGFVLDHVAFWTGEDVGAPSSCSTMRRRIRSPTPGTEHLLRTGWSHRTRMKGWRYIAAATPYTVQRAWPLALVGFVLQLRPLADAPVCCLG